MRNILFIFVTIYGNKYIYTIDVQKIKNLDMPISVQANFYNILNIAFFVMIYGKDSKNPQKTHFAQISYVFQNFIFWTLIR
jgi:hypothetical protein